MLYGTILIIGAQKFNIHTKPAEFLPAAEKPTYGSLDICLVVKGRSLAYILANERPFLFQYISIVIEFVYTIKSYKGRLGFLPW